MYGSRLVICRTHGLPMLSEYRGIRSIGFCQKNFQNIDPIPEDAVIDLDRINHTLAAVNCMFMDELTAGMRLTDRLFIAKALLLDL